MFCVLCGLFNQINHSVSRLNRRAYLAALLRQAVEVAAQRGHVHHGDAPNLQAAIAINAPAASPPAADASTPLPTSAVVNTDTYGTITGRVTLADGTPAQQVAIGVDVVTVDDPTEVVQNIGYLTDAEGLYHITLPAGTYDVKVQVQPEPAPQEVKVTGAQTQTLDIVLNM